ncbi:uncharacterized protein LOC119074369 isoform X2 [Bradysia coprophila]|uniref:uncharacterized protein LOC119074369 isoform X2 n=1 Tax=Bradysia coprophila TaxID=38358 RepID=UPI00187D9C23|nr:uncharacterized protein LOC119074369 isoform X2 [Bradysia coprophila]
MPPRKKINIQRNKKMLEGKAKKKVTVNAEIELSGKSPDAGRCLDEMELDYTETAVCCLAPHNVDLDLDNNEDDQFNRNRIDNVADDEQYILEICGLEHQYVQMDEDEFDNEWNDVVGEFEVPFRKAKLPSTMPDGVEMLEMDENRVVQFVPYQNLNRDV